MKKQVLTAAVMALAGTLLFSSCKKDDDKENRRDLIIGTWTTDFEADDDNNNKSLDESEKVFLSGNDVSTQVFNSDGTGTSAGSGFTVPFTWALQNNDQEITVTITGLGITETSRIHTISSNRFVIENNDNNNLSWAGLKK